MADIIRGLIPALAGQARAEQENLDRRAADKELRDELASVGFTGPKYQAFQEDLARYGISVLRAWMYTGYVFKLTADRGFALHPTGTELEDLHRDPDVREALATMTVAEALPRFRKHALAGGGWRLDGGASLATYFMGACLYVFPNEFRKHRVQQKKWQRQDRRDPAVTAPQASIITDPGVVVSGNGQVRSALARADDREAAIVALTIDGYSQEEIAEVLGETSVRAVEGVLHRWRKKKSTGSAREVHSPMGDATDTQKIRELIERSSLGTPAARRLRARTPRSQANLAAQLADHRERLAACRETEDRAGVAQALTDLASTYLALSSNRESLDLARSAAQQALAAVTELQAAAIEDAAAIRAAAEKEAAGLRASAKKERDEAEEIADLLLIQAKVMAEQLMSDAKKEIERPLLATAQRSPAGLSAAGMGHSTPPDSDRTSEIEPRRSPDPVRGPGR